MIIDVVIPAYNEASRIGDTLKSLVDIGGINSIIVVDDGSSDQTATVVSKFPVKFVQLPRNRGKSAAVMAGVAAANGEYVLMLDADLGESAREIHKLIAVYPLGQDACVVAKFPVIPGRGGGMGLAVRTARVGTKVIGGWEMTAPLSGQRLVRRDTLKKVLPLTYGFGLETSMNIRLAKLGVHLIEVDTLMDHRVTYNNVRGRIHRAKQLLHLVMALTRESVR